MPPDDFYASGSTYHRKRLHLQQQSRRCLEIACELFGIPHSILDVGCGEGALVSYAKGKGIDACGIDLAAPELPGYWRHDLTEPLSLMQTFEWVLCWEVAEHLPSMGAEILCDTLVRHLMKPHGRLLFTAATPGQRGPGHVHLQPHVYWRGLLEQRGLHWQSQESAVLAGLWTKGAQKAPWYGRNVQCFAWA